MDHEFKEELKLSFDSESEEEGIAYVSASTLSKNFQTTKYSEWFLF